MKKLILAFGMALQLSAACAQTSDWRTGFNFNVGCTYLFHDNFKGLRYSGLRLYCAAAANAVYEKHMVLNYGASISFYTKSMGANLNPLVQDLQLDFTNTGSIGYGWGPELSYYKLFRTMDNGAYYNTILDVENALIFSTNFILNNHGRNQVNGAIAGSFNNVTINYYNDGGPPFNWLPLADNFDRYWTGGLDIFVHTYSNYNTFETGFNQFTGYKALLFEVCDQLGIDMPDYNVDGDGKPKSKEFIQNNYNTSAYFATVHLNRFVSVSAGWEGSLKTVNHGTQKKTYFGLQEVIHTVMGFPLHPNQDDGKLLLGANLNNYYYNGK